ncbi:leucine zipper transcription factor-like protein 1 [Oratosquilla oratoria]|uniref:leucine zipper transcription factor-like protein 1 n=1 Tax=Oratosquilla oratoria TaxID=337810 RepID=UPI003F762DD8
MSTLGLNDHHQSQVLGYLRFCKYQRAQRLRSIEACFQDVKETRLNEDNYTSDEVSELLDSLSSVVYAEVEGELLHASHTNSVLLSDLFAQAQKWHLNLHSDTSNLEDKEMLQEVKHLEDRSLQGRPIDCPAQRPPTLAPLTEGEGPAALLQNRIQVLTEENDKLTQALKVLEDKANDAVKEKTQMGLRLRSIEEDLRSLKGRTSDQPSAEEMALLSDEVEKMRLEISSNQQMHETEQQQLSNTLKDTKKQLQAVQSQLHLAEKELERKFYQTGAYLNLRKLLNNKNEQIKVLRSKLVNYEPDDDAPVED